MNTHAFMQNESQISLWHSACPPAKWDYFSSITVYGHQDTEWLCDAPSVFYSTNASVTVTV